MSAQIAILTSPEILHLSVEAQAALGLHAGSRISITIEEGRVTLQPVEEDDLDRLAGSLSSTPRMAEELREDEDKDREAKAKVDRITRKLRGMFADGPSLEDEYFRTRDVDKW